MVVALRPQFLPVAENINAAMKCTHSAAPGGGGSTKKKKMTTRAQVSIQKVYRQMKEQMQIHAIKFIYFASVKSLERTDINIDLMRSLKSKFHYFLYRQ